jgi:3-oxoacyl-[acyl-carrier-protein] synthase II
MEVAIAGGVEPFSRVALTGFSRSRAMTSEKCRPFDLKRDGMILGEGAAIFVLESEDHAIQRGAIPLAVIGSLGLSGDAFHPTAPLQDGSGVARAMENALKLEKIVSGEVDWICAHGSGTLASDKAEALAILNVFGGEVPVSGVKGAFGHALGAASAIQAAVCLMALQHDTVLQTVNLENPDPEFGINLVQFRLKKELTYIMNCGYAFGGLNSALLLKKWK